ncbi:hypothetical protein TNCV_1209491 [Trichonephila clavipes]|nr:hypothetical protein TNCV_1209491 [Trichonephila clavipes]
MGPDNAIYSVGVILFIGGAFAGLGEKGAFGIIGLVAVCLAVYAEKGIDPFNLAFTCLGFRKQVGIKGSVSRQRLKTIGS